MTHADNFVDLDAFARADRQPLAGGAEAPQRAGPSAELLLAVVGLAPRHDDVVDHGRCVTLGAAPPCRPTRD